MTRIMKSCSAVAMARSPRPLNSAMSAIPIPIALPDECCGSTTATVKSSAPRALPTRNEVIFRMNIFRLVLVLAITAFLCEAYGSRALVGQELTSARLLNPSPDSWPIYHGDYSGERHSRLTQITPSNVDSLGLAWAFQTNQPATIKSSPLLVDGILYFTVPDHIWAVDARSGHI